MNGENMLHVMRALWLFLFFVLIFEDPPCHALRMGEYLERLTAVLGNELTGCLFLLTVTASFAVNE